MPIDDRPVSPTLVAWPATAAELVVAQESLESARLVLAVTRRHRTPLPLREARRLARQARMTASGS